MTFDPYHKWLGIPPSEQPPNHYRLLGISRFESDPDVIDSAANRQMAYVQSFAVGDQGAASQRVLNELAAARLCLLDSESKSPYDDALRRKQVASHPQDPDPNQPYLGNPPSRSASAGTGVARGDLDHLMARAKDAHIQKRWTQVIETTSQVIKNDPKRVGAYLLRAAALRRQNRTGRALTDLAVATRLDPQSPHPRVIRAEIFQKQGRFDQAIAEATEALVLDPNNAAAYSIRLESRRLLGDLDGAGQDAEELFRLDPSKEPVDKSCRSRLAISDEDDPEELGVASGYKPESIAKPLPRIGGRSKRSIGNGGSIVLVIGVATVAMCSLWMVYRGAPEPATSQEQADPQSLKVAHTDIEAVAPVSVETAKAPVLEVAGAPKPTATDRSNAGAAMPTTTPPELRDQGNQPKQVTWYPAGGLGVEPSVRDLGSFPMRKGGRAWKVVIPDFTKAEIAFYRGDTSDLTLNAAWEGHLQINGKDVVRFKRSYKDGEMSVFVFDDSTSGCYYTEKNDYKKGELRRYLDVTQYLHPGENSFDYYHEQRPDLPMGVVLRITNGGRASGSGDSVVARTVTRSPSAGTAKQKAMAVQSKIYTPYQSGDYKATCEPTADRSAFSDS
jgi:tetratricopeptide (TPR) repeat protein